MSTKIRHIFQPRQEVEVSDQEAQVLEAQGLLYQGSDEDLKALLASDPVGPLDPRPAVVEPPDKTPAKGASPSDAKPPAATAQKEN